MIQEEIIILEKEKPRQLVDINNLIKLENFPCQMNDFTKLEYEIDEMASLESKYSLYDTLKLDMTADETVDCLVKGYCTYEEQQTLVFFILTTKQLIYYMPVADTIVKKIKVVPIKLLDRIFIHGRFLIILKESTDTKSLDKIEIEIGVKEREPHDTKDSSIINNTKMNISLAERSLIIFENMVKDESHKSHYDIMRVKEYDPYVESNLKSFYLTISIWKIYFILTSKFLPIVKIRDRSYFENITWDKGYIEIFYKNVLSRKIEFITYHIKSLLDNEKLKIKTESHDTDDNIISNEIDGVAFAFYNKSLNIFEYPNESFDYQRVVLKIFKDFLIVIDYFNDYVCFIDMKKIDIVYINETRFVILLYIYKNEERKKSEREKILFFNNNSYDEEYNFFRQMTIKLIEFKRLNKYRYDLKFEFVEKIYENYLSYDSKYFWIKEKNVLIEKKEINKNLIINLLSYQHFLKVEKSKKKCCSKLKNEFKLEKFMKKKKSEYENAISEGEKSSKCVII